MKLYLTSTGLENNIVADYFKTIFLPKELKDLSFLLISVQNDEIDAFYLQKTKDKLSQLGVTDIDIFELRDEKFNAFREYDVMYVCGGNTFVYLDRIRKTGLDKFIIDSINNKSVYVGVSAGSILGGPDITIAGDEDPNDIELKDLKGLGLTNIAIYPHYTEDKVGVLKEFRKTADYQILELTDDQAVYLNDKDMRLINKD